VSEIHDNGDAFVSKRRRGVFATRAPHRPSQCVPIDLGTCLRLALSALRIVSVDEKNLRIRVRGLDLLDGTPVIDIKPYVPYADVRPASPLWPRLHHEMDG